MHVAVSKFFYPMRWEKCYPWLVALALASMLLFWAQRLQQTIEAQHIVQIEYLAAQAACPQTQAAALYLLQQPNSIRYAQYLKLLNAYQMEHTQAQQFAPIALEQRQWP